MLTTKRRRGAQPGNQNAFKQRVARSKPAPAKRRIPARPANAFWLFPRRFVPARRLRATQPAPAAAPRPARPLTALAETLSLLEQELIDLLDDPRCTQAELALHLQCSKGQLSQLLRELSETSFFVPQPPERKTQ